MPAAAARRGVPHRLAMSSPVWVPITPVTGCTRVPNGDVSRPTAGFAHPCAVTDPGSHQPAGATSTPGTVAWVVDDDSTDEVDEKLGMHIAFGRSEHFGGQVGPDAFTKPEAVIHIDRVYVPEMQPDIGVKMVDIALEEGTILPLMRTGEYVVVFA